MQVKCKCVIKRMLNDHEVSLIKHLFMVTGNEGPYNEKIGLIDSDKSMLIGNCPYMFTWGFSAYCVKEEILDKQTG